MSRVDITLMGESIICDVLMFGADQSAMLPVRAKSRTQNPAENELLAKLSYSALDLFVCLFRRDWLQMQI